jgi:hypothetical protein
MTPSTWGNGSDRRGVDAAHASRRVLGHRANRTTSSGRGTPSRARCQGMNGVMGRVENGQIRLGQTIDWSNGQRVLVIAIPALHTTDAPPPQLLEEDAREFARRPDSLDDVNGPELR